MLSTPTPAVLKSLCSSFSALKEPRHICQWVKTTFRKTEAMSSLVRELKTSELVAKFSATKGFKATFTFSFWSPITGRVRHKDVIVEPKKNPSRTCVNEPELAPLIPFNSEDLSFYHSLVIG